MKSIARKCLAGLMLLAAVAAPVRPVAQDRDKHNKEHTHYAVTNMGTLGGGASSAHGINNKGWVTGVANVTGDTAEYASLGGMAERGDH
jgi:hypothetical protein